MFGPLGSKRGTPVFKKITKLGFSINGNIASISKRAELSGLFLKKPAF
jgi:hypothetical protein